MDHLDSKMMTNSNILYVNNTQMDFLYIEKIEKLNYITVLDEQ
jgi:hypothetical protein